VNPRDPGIAGAGGDVRPAALGDGVEEDRAEGELAGGGQGDKVIAVGVALADREIPDFVISVQEIGEFPGGY
jgi:hypothetical protein